MCSLWHNWLRVVGVSPVSSVFCSTSADWSQRKGEGICEWSRDVWVWSAMWVELLCWRLMHAILPNLLFYCHLTKFLPAGYLCVDLTTYLFGSRPPSKFKILCCMSSIDCYSPVFLSFDMGFWEFCKVDLENKPACLWDVLWGQICQGLYLHHQLFWLLVVEVAMAFVVKWDILVDPLWVCDL